LTGGKNAPIFRAVGVRPVVVSVLFEIICMADTDEDVVDDLIDDADEDEEEVTVRIVADPDSRRRVEQKLEDLKLYRITQDYDFDLD